ncbi:MAG: sensor histidine kinase [Lewinellaceae bacterium]|nr:sensor histidine kinase [Lewinellaceae bacterium]
MENNRGLKHGRIYRHALARVLKIRVLLFLCMAPFALWSQPGFEERLSFDQIQMILSEGIAQRDVGKQALGWYKWAIYREQETLNRDSAFQYLARSVDLFLIAGDTTAYYRARAELATRLPERGMAEEALQMQQEALDYFRKTQNKRLETLVLAQMARVYQLKGDTAQASVLKKAFRDKGLMLQDTFLLITVFLDDISRLQIEQNYRDAISLAFRVLELAQQSRRPDVATFAEYQIGILNRQAGDHYMALRFLKRAERSVSAAYDPLRRDIYRYLSATYSALDSLPKALEYATRHIELGDTLLSRDRIATSQRLAVQYGEKERSRQLAELAKEMAAVELSKRQQRDFFYAILLFFGAIILALFFMVRDYRHRLATNRVITEQNEKINQQTIRQLEDALRIESMQSILEGQESERKRIANDLHDSLGGLLAATKMRLENLSGKLPVLGQNEEFGKIQGLLNDTITETRQIARNLQPGSLHQFGLMKAVRDLIVRFRGDGVPTIDFQHFGEFNGIDHTIALNCYRIVQELLQNSIKHAQATEILVQLTRTENELALLVEDNGIGYDPQTVSRGMGTDNLSQRVQFIHGEISIQTSPGQGASTMITVPLA